MAYGSNILKKEAAYYTLVNSTIVDGVLHIGAGGSATQTLSVSDLPAVTKNMLFTCISSDEYSNHYVPDIQVIVYTKMNGDVTYAKAILYPVQVAPNKYSCEFTMKEGTYDEMYVTLTAQKSVDLILWELCAEATDESAIVEIEGVKQALAKLLFDYNTGVFSGDTEETTIAFITCRLLQNTDVQGHFEFTFSNTHPCCMTIRFYDNGSEELFSPLYYDLKPGKNTIGIPHAFLTRLAGRHNFYVTAQVSQGIFTVPVRGALFTIDAGYLAKRELELAMDIQDIAIRQLSADNGPNEIWAVGIDEGIAYVRSRNYKEENVNVGWTAIGSLGRATACAIEFDGDWVLRTDAEQFTLETEEEPWYFWVFNGNLYAHKGLPTELDPPIILDTNVIAHVKAVKGYSSIDYPTQDQGLIVIYIHIDGSICYRAYTYNQEAQAKLWEMPVTLDLPSGRYNFVNIHRLNDYRVAITLSGEQDNLWLLSDRTYVGQSTYPENSQSFQLYEEPESNEPFFQIYPSTYVPPVPEVLYTVQDTYVTVDEQGQEQTHYRFYARLTPELYASEIVWSLYDRFTYSGIDKDMLENIQWVHTNGYTEIIFIFCEAPTSLLVKVTLQSNIHVRLFDGQYVSIYGNSIELIWDTTNYINIEPSEKAYINVQNIMTDVKIKQISTGYSNENASIGLAANCLLQQPVSLKNSCKEEEISITLQPTVQVYRAQDAPV